MLGFRPVFLASMMTLVPATALADGVTIIRPPYRPPAVEQQEVKVIRDSRPVQVKVAITVVDTRETRAARVERALFQRWTGFVRQYSGRRYPF